MSPKPHHHRWTRVGLKIERAPAGRIMVCQPIRKCRCGEYKIIR